MKEASFCGVVYYQPNCRFDPQQSDVSLKVPSPRYVQPVLHTSSDDKSVAESLLVSTLQEFEEILKVTVLSTYDCAAFRHLVSDVVLRPASYAEADAKGLLPLSEKVWFSTVAAESSVRHLHLITTHDTVAVSIFEEW